MFVVVLGLRSASSLQEKMLDRSSPIPCLMPGGCQERRLVCMGDQLSSAQLWEGRYFEECSLPSRQETIGAYPTTGRHSRHKLPSNRTVHQGFGRGL